MSETYISGGLLLQWAVSAPRTKVGLRHRGLTDRNDWVNAQIYKEYLMDKRNIQDLTTATAYDRNGEKLGSVKQVYVNDATGQPDFVEVGHGLFGMSSSLVPLRGHQLKGEELSLAFAKDRIKGAPDIDDESHLSAADHDAIYRHYEVADTENRETYNADFQDPDSDLDRNTTGGVAGGAAGGAVGGVAPGHNDELRDAELRAAGQDRLADRDAAGATGDPVVDPTRDRAAADPRTGEDDSLLLSEERLNVDKERVETGKVRLRKYVVHDTETIEVPVEREEVRIERTPVDADDVRATRGGHLGEEEVSMTTSEEHATVTKQTVPVEEVNLTKDTVRDTETVQEDVAREELDVDGDIDDPTARR